MCNDKKLQTRGSAHGGRPAWKKADLERYESNVSQRLLSYYPGPADLMSPLDIELATMSLVHVLQDAEEGAVVRPRPSRSRLKPQPLDIVQALKNSRVLFSAWKNMGRPGSESVCYEKMHSQKRFARSLQRQNRARERKTLIQDIMDAHCGDQQVFYKLINHQCSVRGGSTQELAYNSCTFKAEEVSSGFRNYFQALAIPSNNDNFNTDHLNQVEEDMAFLDRLCTVSNRCNVTVTKEETHRAVKKLRVGKAADIYGLTAEHLLHAGEVLIPVLAWMFSAILTRGTIPSVFQKGLLLPLLKKPNKPRKIPTNHRGITIISVIGKLLEHIIMQPIVHTFRSAQSGLQGDFTQEVAPLFASFILCEAICEFQDQRKGLTVILLDAEKAFDGLFRKLGALQIPVECWMVHRDWYRDLNNTVKWNGTLSHTFPIHQGTLQGSVISPHAYKMNGNDTLVDIQAQHIGAIIGTVCCAAPTCADDVALIASTESGEMSTLLNTIETHAVCGTTVSCGT